MDKIRIIMLGGQDESFKNMTAVEINNDIFVIEAGFKLPDKTKPGIDFIIPRYDYLVSGILNILTRTIQTTKSQTTINS